MAWADGVAKQIVYHDVCAATKPTWLLARARRDAMAATRQTERKLSTGTPAGTPIPKSKKPEQSRHECFERHEKRGLIINQESADHL